ncbi:MAG TPA: hypothetical protein VEK07_10915 [Polyangiaceae bacterium]|nr:hypothetical protein [Polyangiaceae bacterium]
MLDHVGAVQHVVVSGTLWLLVVPLLLGLGFHALSYIRRARSGRLPGAHTVVGRLVGLGSIGLVTGAALGHMLVLLRAPTLGRAYWQAIPSGIRVGGADVCVVLVLDWVSAALCAFACVLVFAVAVWSAVRPPSEGESKVWASLELTLAGALVSFLADGLIAALIGWSIAIAAGAWLAGWKEPRAGVAVAGRGAAALLTLAFGAFWLFWASAGTWDGREFSVRQGPGLFALPSPPAAAGSGFITLTHAPGAAVYVDEARVPIATAPFVDVPIPRGFHTVRVHVGRASGEQEGDLVVDVNVPDQGESFDLAVSGPSLSPRDLGLAWSSERARPSAPWTPDAVAVTVVLCIWVVGAWLVSVPQGVFETSVPLATVAHGMTTALVGPLWLLRASDLLVLAPRMKLVLPGAVAAILIVAMGVVWAAAAGRRDGRAIVTASVIFERVPTRLGLLLVRFERWVLDAVIRVAAAAIRVAAWITGRFDTRVLSKPGEAFAASAVWLGRCVESLVGMSIGTIAWAIVGLAAAVVAAHGFWSNR